MSLDKKLKELGSTFLGKSKLNRGRKNRRKKLTTLKITKLTKNTENKSFKIQNNNLIKKITK